MIKTRNGLKTNRNILNRQNKTKGIDNMNKKKTVGRDIVEMAIKRLNQVETLEDLEQVLGVKLTKQLLSEINRQINRMKKKTADAKRKYSAAGKRELVQEQKVTQQTLEQLHQKFIGMREKREHSKNPLDERSQLNRERKKIWQEIEEGNYWLNDQTKDLFSYYQHLVVHGDRIDALQSLLVYYIEDAQSLKEVEVSTTDAMYDVANATRVVKRNPFIPWKALPTKAPTKEFYAPFEERLQQIKSILRIPFKVVLVMIMSYIMHLWYQLIFLLKKIIPGKI